LTGLEVRVHNDNFGIGVYFVGLPCLTATIENKTSVTTQF